MCQHSIGSFTSLSVRSVDRARQQHGNTSLSQFVLLLMLWSCFFTYNVCVRVYVCVCVPYLCCNLQAQLKAIFHCGFSAISKCSLRVAGCIWGTVFILLMIAASFIHFTPRSTVFSLSLSLSFSLFQHSNSHFPGGRCYGEQLYMCKFLIFRAV